MNDFSLLEVFAILHEDQNKKAILVNGSEHIQYYVKDKQLWYCVKMHDNDDTYKSYYEDLNHPAVIDSQKLYGRFIIMEGV